MESNQASNVAIEHVDPHKLKAHPRNYKKHPDAQIVHIARSIKEHGFYRNVVVARGDVILAGHGVVQAAKYLNKPLVPVIRVDIEQDDPRALKIMTGDNEIGRIGEVDDRALTELLKDIMGTDVDALLGTGFDDKQLAALLLVTRPESEIRDINEASEWIGMPEYEETEYPFKVVVSLKTEEDRASFLCAIGAEQKYIHKSIGRTTTLWWPLKEKQDLSSLRFEEDVALPFGGEEQ